MKSKNIIIIASISLLVCCLFFWKKRALTKEDFIVQEYNLYKDAEIKAEIIPSENNTFGYNIYLYDTILIHQPLRPSLPGNVGFTTKEDALKVAELVIKKIHNNELPPTVTIQELQVLGVF